MTDLPIGTIVKTKLWPGSRDYMACVIKGISTDRSRLEPRLEVLALKPLPVDTYDNPSVRDGYVGYKHVIQPDMIVSAHGMISAHLEEFAEALAIHLPLLTRYIATSERRLEELQDEITNNKAFLKLSTPEVPEPENQTRPLTLGDL